MTLFTSILHPTPQKQNLNLCWGDCCNFASVSLSTQRELIINSRRLCFKSTLIRWRSSSRFVSYSLRAQISMTLLSSSPSLPHSHVRGDISYLISLALTHLSPFSLLLLLLLLYFAAAKLKRERDRDRDREIAGYVHRTHYVKRLSIDLSALKISMMIQAATDATFQQMVQELLPLLLGQKPCIC